MKLWLATANLERIESCLKYGVFEGVITNPHVVALEKRNPINLFKDIISLCEAAYYQLKDDNTEQMLKEAERMLAIDPDKIRIKVPATREGLGAIHNLTRSGLNVMATAVPTASWMILAAAAGAKQVAPYSGMLQKRNILSKSEGVFRMQEIIDRQRIDTEICTGIYHATDIADYAVNGIASGFIWEKDVEAFLTQDLVNEAVSSFKSDWSSISNY